MLEASMSRMSETQIQCPRMQGLPKQTFGSIDMRFSNSPRFMACHLVPAMYVSVALFASRGSQTFVVNAPSIGAPTARLPKTWTAASLGYLEGEG